jgi:hypothetical protein
MGFSLWYYKVGVLVKDDIPLPRDIFYDLWFWSFTPEEALKIYLENTKQGGGNDV